MQNNNKYRNGFLYLWIKGLCTILYKMNAVEKFKDIIWWIVRRKLFKVSKTKENEIRIKSIAIDIYKIIKVVIILYFWILDINNTWAIGITFYLIITTLMTYLRYHFWEENPNNDYERNRRRFISMILSFTFIIISYGYLYDVPFEYALVNDDASPVGTSITCVNNAPAESERISWDEALLYSTSNAFGGNYSSIEAIDKAGDWLSISQFIITFVYITLIFAKSLFSEGEKENGIQK